MLVQRPLINAHLHAITQSEVTKAAVMCFISNFEDLLRRGRRAVPDVYCILGGRTDAAENSGPFATCQVDLIKLF